MHDFERLTQVIGRSERVCVDKKMPIDFTSYLLSASPPGFETFEFRHRNGYSGIRSFIVQDNIDSPLDRQKSFSDTYIYVESCEELNEPLCDSSQSAPCQLFAKGQRSREKGKKRVSFADEIGGPIACVRIITESPDTPPNIHPAVLSFITRGALPGALATPPLVLGFDQPASNYVLFREKVDKNFVSLENVILQDYNILGTVKVKNIAFEKEVSIRCSYDNWETQVDFSANYVPLNGVHTGPGNNIFDTFSFEISVPPNFDITKKIQFAICYEVNGCVYWDNNGGKNYNVMSSEYRSVGDNPNEEKSSTVKSQEPVVFDPNFSDSWTEFSSWTNIDNEVYY